MHLAPDALKGLAGDWLFYPCAGGDSDEFLGVFASQCRKFLFVDIDYDLTQSRQVQVLQDAVLRSSECIGPAASPVERRRKGRSVFRYIEPGERRETYDRNGECSEIVWRRGFGQFALADLPDRSIRIFVHRGDSCGEGGSNVFFFEKRRGHIPQLTNLFDTLCAKLSNEALVITDGSNIAAPEPFTRFHRQSVTGREAFDSMKYEAFDFGPFAWRCCGFMSARYGPTLVWRLTRRAIAPLGLSTSV